MAARDLDGNPVIISEGVLEIGLPGDVDGQLFLFSDNDDFSFGLIRAGSQAGNIQVLAWEELPAEESIVTLDELGQLRTGDALSAFTNFWERVDVVDQTLDQLEPVDDLTVNVTTDSDEAAAIHAEIIDSGTANAITAIALTGAAVQGESDHNAIVGSTNDGGSTYYGGVFDRLKVTAYQDFPAGSYIRKKPTSSGSETMLAGYNSADTPGTDYSRFRAYHDGLLAWGAGGASPEDCALARLAAGILALDTSTSLYFQLNALFKLVSTPSAPASGRLALFADTADGHLKRINSSGTVVDLEASAANFTWTEVTGTSQSAAVNNGYICNNAGLVTVTLPSTAAVGDIVELAGKGAGLWKLAQNSGQTVHFNSTDTTTGTGGSLAATNRYNTLRVICITANTDWVVLSSSGSITVV